MYERGRVVVNFTFLAGSECRLAPALGWMSRLFDGEKALPQEEESRLDRVSTGSGSDLVQSWESRIVRNVAC